MCVCMYIVYRRRRRRRRNNNNEGRETSVARRLLSSAMAEEDQEALLERFLTRLALTDDSKLESVLKKLLPYAISCLASPRQSIKQKVSCFALSLSLSLSRARAPSIDPFLISSVFIILSSLFWMDMFKRSYCNFVFQTKVTHVHMFFLRFVSRKYRTCCNI